MKKFISSTTSKIFFIIFLGLCIWVTFSHDPYSMKIKNPILGFYHVHKGDIAYRNGKIKEALRYYNKALVEYPQHFQARCNLANIYYSLEDYPSAIEEYKIALQYKPDYMVCRMNLGKVYAEELSEYDEAIHEYDTITKTKRSNLYIPFVINKRGPNKENKSNAYYNMGLAYRWKTVFIPKEKLYHNNNLEKAIASYKEALKINKKDYDTYYNLAVAEHLAGNQKEAGLTYCKAIAIRPLNYESHVNLAILLDEMGYHKEAIVEFNKAGLLLGNKDEAHASYLNDLTSESYRKQLIRDEEKYKKYLFYDEKEIKKIQKEEEKKEEESYIEFKKGKMVLKEESESDIKRRMHECEAKEIFKGL